MAEEKEVILNLDEKVVGSGDVKLKPEVAKREGLRAEYKLTLDSMQANVEPHYYWILDFLSKAGHFGLGMSGDSGRVEKLRDIYTAGITSAFWGAQEQRKSVQQEKAMNMLATIGKMVKDTFQIIREIRIIKERLSFYNASKGGDQSAEIALKGTWIDMVEGGAKNPASIYGLAAQVGFGTLPDLFFRVTPKNAKNIDSEVAIVKKNFGLNPKVCEVLSRKLKQFMEWKEKTYMELSTREKFVLKYLRQHYNSIKLYMDWLRPYLRNVKELQMSGESSSAALAKAFDTSRIELELLGIMYNYKSVTSEGYEVEKKFYKYYPCVWVTIKFTAVPMMAYQQEYQRGAIHSGNTEIFFKGVVLSEEDIKKYKEQQDIEDMEILNSVFESMEALGEEFEIYLKEAGETVKEKEVEEEKPKSITPLTPFVEVFKGFGELFGAFGLKGKKVEKGEVVLPKGYEKAEMKKASGDAAKLTFITYDVFKKAHGMMAW